jgi:hypothetical protein
LSVISAPVAQLQEFLFPKEIVTGWNPVGSTILMKQIKIKFNRGVINGYSMTGNYDDWKQVSKVLVIGQDSNVYAVYSFGTAGYNPDLEINEGDFIFSEDNTDVRFSLSNLTRKIRVLKLGLGLV